jgi:hypothetical protein
MEFFRIQSGKSWSIDGICGRNKIKKWFVKVFQKVEQDTRYNLK